MSKKIILVACTNANGSPDLAIMPVSFTKKQRKNGEHYEGAIGDALKDGYEGPFVAFDESEHKNIVRALAQASAPDAEIIDEPYTVDELKKRANKDGYVTAIVKIDLNDVIDHNLEGLLDKLSDAVTGTEILSNIDYEVVAAQNNTLYFKVCGCVTDIINDD